MSSPNTPVVQEPELSVEPISDAPEEALAQENIDKLAEDPSRHGLMEFELLAPNNEKVRLIGSWDWNRETPMKKGADGVWRAKVQLKDGDYQYRFRLISRSYFSAGEDVSVADPKAMEITLDAEENSILHVRDGKRSIMTYEWQHDDAPLPSNDQLVIYEMHVRDFRGGEGDTFTGNGTFTTAINKLDYLADLGINAIEVMPITEFPGDYSWGYAQRSLFAVENSYGTLDELAHFVDEAHKRGIRIIHDVVYNHMNSEAPLTKIDYAYWFYEQNPDERSLQFGPKFNYEYYDETLKLHPARQHVIESMLLWIDRFHMDGIRFDCTRAIRYYELLEWFHDVIHGRIDFKPFYTIAEHIPQDVTIAGAGGPMDSAWHDSFYRQMVAVTVGAVVDGRDPFDTTETLRVMDGRADGFLNPINTVHYIDNHDQTRTMRLLGEVANTFGEAAHRRSKLGATLLLTSPGIPMLWMGQEFGQSSPKTMETQPLDWSLLENPDGAGLHAHYRKLIHLRREHSALHNDSFQSISNLPERGILAYKRWNDQGGVVVVAANLKPQYAGEFQIDSVGLEDGTWREMVYGYDVQIQGGVLKDTLAEAEAKIYVKI